MAEEEIKKEQQLLVRATVNYLFLAQFETFRASLLRLNQKHPALAVAILQTVIEKGARIEGVAWSSRTSSPAHLTWLSIAELLNLETSTSAHPQALQLKAEFLLLIESIKSRIIPQTLTDQPQGPSNDRNGESAEVPAPEKATSSEGDGSLLFFESLSSCGLQRLQAEIFKSANSLPESLTESEAESVRRIARDHPELMAGLCDNIQRQMNFQSNSASKLAISLYDHGKALKEAEDDRLQSSGDRPPGVSSSVSENAKDDFKLGLRIEEEAQLAHLDVLKESLERRDLESAIQRLRFLRQDNGLPSSMYWSIIRDLIKVLKTPDDDIGSQRFHLQMQEQMLKIYEEVLTSNSKQLTKMVEDIQDDLIHEEVEVNRVSNEYSFPPPLEKLDRLLKDLHTGHITLSIDLSTAEGLVTKSCKRELYHFARVSGEHVLEVVLKAALFAVKNEHLQEASNILALYPRLQPLVAAMGWDLLSGKTTARRKMLELLWTTKSTQLRLEDLSIYGRQGEEICCVEYLCDHLCFRLELAYFAACNNSGQNWDPKTCLLFSGKKGKRISEDTDGGPLDPFVANFVLERLAVQTPLRVLFDVVPDIKFKDALELVNMQPVPCATAAWHRLQDVELLHMHYGLQSAVLALGVMERSMSDDGIETNDQVALWFLKELQDHLEAIGSPPRKLWMMNIIISLLHMDDISINTNQSKLSYLHARISSASAREELAIPSPNKSEDQSVVAVIGFILKLLYRCLPSAGFELELKPSWSAVAGGAGKQAWEWRASTVKQFVEDWEWRLSVLKRLLPSPERQWNWKEALAILRAAPSTLLNLCMQRAQYDIGEEAVHRFALPPEDKVALQLAEWVDSAFTRASVEDAVSRVAEGTLSSEGGLDFATFRSHLGTLATVLLCIDVAVTSARSTNMAAQLLDQARSLLSEISTGCSQREGLIHWEQIQELCIISVAKRVLQRSQELLDQYKTGTLQATLSGETVVPASLDSNRQGNRHRALFSLQQIIEDAHRGKRQFLSGKLHNLVKAITDEESDESNTKVGSTYAERKAVLPHEQEIFLGLGFRPARQVPSSAPTSDQSGESLQFGIKSAGKRLIGHLSSRQSAYLAAFIRYIATIGDIVDGIDTTHDFNFFSLVYEWPNDLLTRLVFERGSADAAGKVADVMGADLVHEVISACVPPVFPPRSKNGWACIPRAAYSQQNVENGFHGNLSSASMYSRSHASVFGKSKDVKAQFYPLRLNVVKHLATISPVRAVLACVFGSSIFSAGYEYSDTVGLKKSSSDSSDADRIFYEFSLDQSYRFPTLNRWIQMQANLHRLSDSPITSRRVTETNLQNKEDKRITVKRLRESEGNESEEDDDVILGMPSTKSVFDIESKDDPTSSAIPQDVMNSRNLNPECINSLLFDWDNEVPYEEAVESLIEEGKLLDALALSDRCLRDGASDRLLQLLIERGEEGHLQSGQLYGYGTHQSFWSSSWQYCIRLRDKRLAANLALKYLHRWELDKAMDVLTMCSCHLDEKDPLRREVVHRKQALQRCNHILCVDGRFGSWQEVEAECKVDPEGLALRLAGKGAVSAALEVAESAGLSIELRRELQGRQLVKLLTADPIGGGGPAEASRFLCSLHEPDDALPVAMGAMQQLPNLQSKQLLVHFFLKRGMGTLSDSEAARLNRWALGLRVLGALPLPWQQRCSALHEHPHLILETLLMWKQLQSAKQLLNEFPSLRDEHLILTYAAKAIAVSTYPSSERRSSMANVASKPSPRTSASTRSNFSNSLSNLQKEARRAFSWTSRDSGNKIAPKEMNRKRKSSGLPPSQRVAWEAMAGIQEDRTPVFSVDGQERLASVAMAEGWVLTGDPVKDEGVRLSHRYESAPDIILLKALLSLCSDQSVAAKGALELCITQMKHVLSAQQIPLNASTEIVGRAYHATETFVQVLAHAKTELRKFSGRAELSTSMNKSRETDDGSSDTGSSSTGNQLTDELSELLAQADLWLSHAELLQSLLGSGVVASLDDVADKESAAQLRDRLIKDERYSMAVYTCKKCKIDAFPVWNAWGHALIRMEHYTQARVKFKQALQLHKGDPAPVIREIINTIEAGPPVDKAGVHSLYDHLAKSAPTILDDSLSADAYLNVLYMPSSFPRSERLRRPSEDSADPYKTFSSSTQEMAEDGPRSNLDNVRYMECVSYLQEYARVEILEFMFRHGHYKEACLLFFPPNAVPAPPQSSMHQQPTASSLPQRQDSILATDYGTIDDLCELCIGNGAMPVLEHVIAMRSIGSSTQETAVNQHTANALTRICNYCETHRNFNHLYRFQVLRKDHVAAGLCCIQLFLNSPHQEQALKHLEHAKMHFEDGLAARHKLKNIPKPGRGKSASEKLTEEELVKFSARVAIQMDVVRCFSDAEFPPWKHSLFGNPNDSETFRRRCEIAETLVERNFDLAFQIIYEFNLPAVHIYAGVAASLAERKKGNQLTEFLKNIRGTIEEDDWDQVLGAAINVFANRHRERPDKLIDMLSSSHRKVLACVVCGRLKSAFQIASRSGNVADVQYVAHQALKSGALPVLDMCKQWLAQYM